MLSIEHIDIVNFIDYVLVLEYGRREVGPVRRRSAEVDGKDRNRNFAKPTSVARVGRAAFQDEGTCTPQAGASFDRDDA